MFFSTELFRLSVELLSDVNQSKDPKTCIAFHADSLASDPSPLQTSRVLCTCLKAMPLVEIFAKEADMPKIQVRVARGKKHETFRWHSLTSFNQNHPQAQAFCGVYNGLHNGGIFL